MNREGRGGGHEQGGRGGGHEQEREGGGHATMCDESSACMSIGW